MGLNHEILTRIGQKIIEDLLRSGCSQAEAVAILAGLTCIGAVRMGYSSERFIGFMESSFKNTERVLWLEEAEDKARGKP